MKVAARPNLVLIAVMVVVSSMQYRPALIFYTSAFVNYTTLGYGDVVPVERWRLYACLFSGLVFWLFCSSRHTAITVTSAISLLVGASLAD